MKRSFCMVVTVLMLFGCDSKKKVDTPKAKTPETKAPVVKKPTQPKVEEKKEEAKPAINDGEIKGKDCIKDQKAHAKQRLKKLTGEEVTDMIHGEFDDVDGDGQKEKTSSVVYAYNANTVLYLSNKGCLHEGGNFMGTAFTAQKTSTNGKKDIELWTKGGGCAGLAGSITPFKWDEATKQYKAGKEINCQCPMNSRVKKFHPSCPGARNKAKKPTGAGRKVTFN